MREDTPERLALALPAGVALAAALLHGGQDLAVGEPARLGVSPQAFVLAFLAYGAAAAAAVAVGPRSRVAVAAGGLLTGLFPLSVAFFHWDALGRGAYGAVLWISLGAGASSLALHGRAWELTTLARDAERH